MNKLKNDLFYDLFVLELANNHRGDIEKGKKIILEFAKIAKEYNVKAAIKLQFRDVDSFVHKNFKNRFDINYIERISTSKLKLEEYKILVDLIKQQGLITASTPFDEKSVDYCNLLDIDIIKIASYDINDWVLLDKAVLLNKPVILSTGGADIAKIDKAVSLFNSKNIPLALNHCVSIYPTKKEELNLDRIDFLKNRYPDCTIGFSTHEYNKDLELSFIAAYAKGIRTYERHIDIDYNNQKPYDYCSKPSDIKKVFEAYKKIKPILGSKDFFENKKEKTYIEGRLRGYFAKTDIEKGAPLKKDDFYQAIPISKNQISIEKRITGSIAKRDIKKDECINYDYIEF